jgi:hypothetical protein
VAVGVGEVLVLSKLVTSRSPPTRKESFASLARDSTGESRSTQEDRVVHALLSLETRLERVVVRLERRETFIIILFFSLYFLAFSYYNQYPKLGPQTQRPQSGIVSITA